MTAKTRTMGGGRIGVACGTPSRQRVWQREQMGAATSPIFIFVLHMHYTCASCYVSKWDREIAKAESNRESCTTETDAFAANVAKRLGYEVTMSQRTPRYFSPFRRSSYFCFLSISHFFFVPLIALYY